MRDWWIKQKGRCYRNEKLKKLKIHISQKNNKNKFWGEGETSRFSIIYLVANLFTEQHICPSNTTIISVLLKLLIIKLILVNTIKFKTY